MEGSQAPKLAVVALVAAAMGAVGAAVTVAFLEVFVALRDLLWDTVPDALGMDGGPSAAFTVGVCVVGGLLVGVGRARLGEWPVSIEQALADFRRDRAFDTAHLWQAALLSIISLGFGAALGPEAALTALLGGLGTLVGRYVSASAAARSSITYVGIVGSLGALFGHPGAAALPLGVEPDERDEGTAAPRGRLWLLVPGLAAALAGAWVFRNVHSEGSYFDLDLPDYDFAAADLAWAVLPALAGVVIAVAFVLADRGATAAVAAVADRKVAVSAGSGVVLGALGATSGLMLFSGHEGIRTIVADPGATVGYLVLLAVGKAVAANVCLAGGWKGGRFFPVMFCGVAAGLAVGAALSEVGTTPAVAAGMAAALATLLCRPAAAAILSIAFFPLAAWPLAVVGALVGAVAVRILSRRAPVLLDSGLESGEEGDGDTLVEADGI